MCRCIPMKYTINKEQGFSDYFCCKYMLRPNQQLHVHSHIEFVFALHGRLSLTLEQKSYALEKGSMVVILPYEIHSYHGEEDTSAFVLACPLEYIPEYRQILTSHVFEPPVCLVESIQTAIIADIIAGNCSDELKMKALIYCTLSRLLKISHLEKKLTFEYDLYRKAIVYISEHYREPLTLEQTARYAGVSTAHLSRVLHADGKPGFSEILNSLRIHAAKTMLEQEDASISEIAFNAGFGSIRNFNRIFKKYFGCNPSDIKIPGSKI